METFNLLITTPIYYSIGVILAFILFRWGRRKLMLKSDWGLILVTAFLSLFSWFCVLALIFVIAIYLIVTGGFGNPPKWL